jgi:hypothetical protein
MTTANGTYMFCDADLSFAISLTCTGPSCSSILGHNSLTCTQASSQSWDCTNGIKCGSAAGFTSKFSINGTNTTVSHTQNVALNGTSFMFQQDGAGDATLSNGTTTMSSGPSGTGAAATSTQLSTSASSAASPSASKSGSNSSRQSYSAMILLAMLFLSVFVTQASAQVTGSSITTSVNSIFQFLDKVGGGKSQFDIGASAIAGQFSSITGKTCAALVGQGTAGLSSLPLVYGQCEEAMAGGEMYSIGSASNVNLSTYTGLGGVQVNALTAAEEATVLSNDAGAIPELFLANSALCGLLVAVIQSSIQNPTSENLCAALANAVVSHEPTSTASSSSTSATPAPNSASASPAQPTSSTTGQLPAGFNANKCVECYLNTYLDSLQTLSAETCNNAPFTTASAYDLSSIFCDPSIASDPASTAFCKSLCANPCASFAVADIISGMGGDYIANPSTDSSQLAKLCNTCTSPPGQGSGNYQCSSVPDCLCGIGTKLCAKGCSGVA